MKSDRRRDFRFHPPQIRVTAENLSLTLLDLCRSGMNIESRGPAPIICGDVISFTLDDGLHSVEVLGQVRWADSAATESGGTSGCRAGISFLRFLSERTGMWDSLHIRLNPGLPDPSAPTVESQSEETLEDRPLDGPGIEMVEPADGNTVGTPVIEIVGRVDEALAVVSLSVNGVPATLEGSRFVSTVRLKSGDNKISATVHKSSGGYTTCLLGTLKLDPRWQAKRRRYPS